MAIYGSIWNGDDWATRGGLDKINYTYAPFTATYSRFQIDACAVRQPSVWPPCFANTTSFWWSNYTLSDSEKRSYTSFTKRYTIYNYCNDKGRFRTMPRECGIPPW
jgi:xyloglucan:xyloglucosyl transferase